MKNNNGSATSVSSTGRRPGGFFFMLIILAGINFWSDRVLASECDVTSTVAMTANFNTISIPADLAIGQSITQDKTFSQVTIANCTGKKFTGDAFQGWIDSTLSFVGNYNGRNTYYTNIPGVGIQFGAKMAIDIGSTHPSYTDWLKGNVYQEMVFSQSISQGQIATVYFTPMLNLIKIDSSVGSGALSGSVGYGQIMSDAGTPKVTVNLAGTVSGSSCSITSGQDLSFVLDDVHKSDLPSVGSYWGENGEKDITLSCNTGTNVYITFSGTQATDSTDASVLQNNGSAKGIGVQLLDVHSGDKPINLGAKISMVTGSGSTATIPIGARYVRIGDLTSGSVDASATYTLNYD